MNRSNHKSYPLFKMYPVGARVVLLTLAVQLCVASSAPGFVQSKLVRVNLEKKTSPQKGHLGQPVTSYFVNVHIGTPPKEYKMLLDMNGREVWLPHHSRVGLLLNRLNYSGGYSKKASSTSFKEEKDIYNIGYKGTQLSGKAYNDLWEFKDVTESLDFPRFRQRFLAISSASNDQFTRFAVDGVLAINPWPVSETGSELVAVSMTRANLTRELKVGLLLDQNETTTYGGELTFGGTNPTKYLGALRFHPVVSQHSWELKLSIVMLGHESIYRDDDTSTALISTSSNDIYGPPKHIMRILKHFGYSDIENDFDDEKLYDIDCLKVAQAPFITFVIDDAYYMLNPLSYIGRKTEGLLFKSQTCYLAILSNKSTNKWELGTRFVSNYYTVFDLRARQIALARRS